MRKPHAAICGALLAGCCSFCGEYGECGDSVSRYAARQPLYRPHSAIARLERRPAEASSRREANKTDANRSLASHPSPQPRLLEWKCVITWPRSAPMLLVRVRAAVSDSSSYMSTSESMKKAWPTELSRHTRVHRKPGRPSVTSHTCSFTVCATTTARVPPRHRWTGTTKLFHKTIAHWGGSAHTHRLPHQ